MKFAATSIKTSSASKLHPCVQMGTGEVPREDTRRSRGCLRTREAHLQCGSWLQGISFCNFKIILRRKNKNKHIKSTILFIQQLHLGTYNTGHPCGEKQPKTHIPQARLTTCKHRAGRSSAPRGRSVDSGPQPFPRAIQPEGVYLPTLATPRWKTSCWSV